jgi:hypothetical protein
MVILFTMAAGSLPDRSAVAFKCLSLSTRIITGFVTTVVAAAAGGLFHHHL